MQAAQLQCSGKNTAGTVVGNVHAHTQSRIL